MISNGFNFESCPDIYWYIYSSYSDYLDDPNDEFTPDYLDDLYKNLLDMLSQHLIATNNEKINNKIIVESLKLLIPNNFDVQLHQNYDTYIPILLKSIQENFGFDILGCNQLINRIPFLFSNNFVKTIEFLLLNGLTNDHFELIYKKDIIQNDNNFEHMHKLMAGSYITYENILMAKTFYNINRINKSN